MNNIASIIRQKFEHILKFKYICCNWFFEAEEPSRSIAEQFEGSRLIVVYDGHPQRGIVIVIVVHLRPVVSRYIIYDVSSTVISRFCCHHVVRV